MNPEPIVLIHSMTVETRAAPDRLTRWLLVLIALGLAWQALRPHVAPVTAEAARETTNINIERVGALPHRGRHPGGVHPVSRGKRPDDHALARGEKEARPPTPFR